MSAQAERLKAERGTYFAILPPEVIKLTLDYHGGASKKVLEEEISRDSKMVDVILPGVVIGSGVTLILVFPLLFFLPLAPSTGKLAASLVVFLVLSASMWSMLPEDLIRARMAHNDMQLSNSSTRGYLTRSPYHPRQNPGLILKSACILLVYLLFVYFFLGQVVREFREASP